MVITRFAPSPTGEPHIGNIRTALFTWLFARLHKGKFYLRIEDTDKVRETPGAVESILESLEWLRIDYDEIPNSEFQIPNKTQNQKSKFPKLIFQSSRLDIYKQYALQLVEKGLAYICTCTEERLQKLREEQQGEGKSPMYDGHCRQIQNSKFKIENSVIRLKVPTEGITEFTDLIRGKVAFENKLIDDQVLLKSDGYPTYHLANVVDDHEMGVTHVIRGEDWLSSTPKHLLLYNFFNWNVPAFAHLPMILGKDKTKLSKRHGAVSVLEYKRLGYVEEALYNYLALLGWNPGDNREFFSRAELIEQFSLERIQKSPAIFDNEKLTWMNGWYIRRLSVTDSIKRLENYGRQYDTALIPLLDYCRAAKNLAGVIKLVQDRMRTLKDFVPLTAFIKELNEYDSSLLIFKKSSPKTTKEALVAALELVRTISEKEFICARLQHYFNHLIAQHGFAVGEVLHPLRVAVTGLKDSPGAFETMEVLGKKETIRRIKLALQKLSAM